jgi:hypothetical protein
MAGDEVVAERGGDSVQNYVYGDAKTNFPFFTAITAESERVPLILITKGRAIDITSNFEGAMPIASRSGIRLLDGPRRY